MFGSKFLWIVVSAGVDFLAFRPSQIAAAVALTVLGETHIVEVERAINFCTHVEKVLQLHIATY